MEHTRLKSSFIYLANAVNDLRMNWAVLAAGLAPLILLAAICLLPDALNLQHLLADRFTPGTRHVVWRLVQEPDVPALGDVKPLFPGWAIAIFHLLVVLFALASELVVLCTMRRTRSGARQAGVLREAIAIWREAVRLLPAFFWVVILHLAAPLIAVLVLRAEVYTSEWWVAILVYVVDVVLIATAPLLYLWLYFAEYALVFDGKHSFHALLFSRDLMRKHFFRVATRIVVFLAVWSGYDSWAAAAFFVMSLILGPVGVLTGYFWAVIFIVELVAVGATYLTTAFFLLAGLRLYQDLAPGRGIASAAPPADALAVTTPLLAAEA